MRRRIDEIHPDSLAHLERYAWPGNVRIVDPILRTLEASRLDGDRWIVASAHGGPIRSWPSRSRP